jgi:hypothetical protein
MYLLKVSEIVNVIYPLINFIFSNEKMVTCAAHGFLWANLLKLPPTSCMLFPKCPFVYIIKKKRKEKKKRLGVAVAGYMGPFGGGRAIPIPTNKGCLNCHLGPNKDSLSHPPFSLGNGQIKPPHVAHDARDHSSFGKIC